MVDGSVKVNTADDVSRIPLLLLMLLLLLPLLGANELTGERNKKIKHFFIAVEFCDLSEPHW